MKVEIVKAEHSHIEELAKNMRKQDREEIEMFGISHTEGLWNSYIQSDVNKTILVDGKVAACFGCAPKSASLGTPWLLTTKELEKVLPLKFYRMYREEVREMLATFHKLENFVDPRYTKAVRLLEILGFKIGQSEPHGKGIYKKFSIARGGI